MFLAEYLSRNEQHFFFVGGGVFLTLTEKAPHEKKRSTRYSQTVGSFPTMYFFSEAKGEKRACQGIPNNARTNLVEQLIKDVTGKTSVCDLYNYGCWCGRRGHGKYVDNFD